uniref:Uncharacterized protein n=1 Tax=Arundo donax TaxID=35708 RepID=A0A0A9CLC9_ARUDO
MCLQLCSKYRLGINKQLILRVKVTWEHRKDHCPWIHHPYMDRE